MLRELILRFVHRNDEQPRYYTGKVRLMPVLPEDIQANSYCVTRYGVGRIVDVPNGLRDKVVVVHTGNKRRHVDPDKILRFVAFNEDLLEFVPIAPSDYNYIVNGDQTIEFRVTRNGYAQLTKACRDNYEGYAILQRRQNGRQLLANLLSKGWQISK